MAGYPSLLLRRHTRFGAWCFRHFLYSLLCAGYRTLFQLESLVLVRQCPLVVDLELCYHTLRIDRFAPVCGLADPAFSYFQLHLSVV